MSGIGRLESLSSCALLFFFFQAEDGIRDYKVTGVQTCALPISSSLSEGSVLGANNIYLQAGRDISVTGSHVVGQGDVGLVAGRDVQLLAGQDSAAATSHSETKKSGLFSGGGFRITLGSKSVTIDRSNESVRAAG